MKIISFTLLFLIKQVFSYSVYNQKIYDNSNHLFNLSGISWFGFETQDFVINGLWSHPVDFYLDTIKNNGFNTIRIPFSAEWINYNYDIYPYNGLISGDPKMQNKKSIEILDYIVDRCMEKNLKIMFDLHRLHKEYISELWYSPTDNMFTSDTYYNSWFKLMDRYKDKKNIIALDLLNEPHGVATWGDSNPSTDWNQFAIQTIYKFQERYPNNKWLYLIEGINWGKDLSNVRNFPIKVSKELQNRVIYSAHCYGKSVVQSVDVYDTNALRQDWDHFFGFIADMGQLFIIGEYGGITEIDQPWMDRFIEYLIEKKMRNNFFWSLGPNSGDVHGLLLDDWTTLDLYKVKIIKKLQPYPTFS
jgi:aryl-phospho-beta-D-glucosidase BglC (GH1 family)